MKRFTRLGMDAIIPNSGDDFASCHAPTLLRLSDDHFLCAYMAGTREGMPDMAIWLSTCIAGTWQPPVRLHHGDCAHWNPVLLQSGSRIHLYFKRGETVHSWQTLHSHSDDNGLTWSAPVDAVPGDTSPRVCVRNKILIDSAGRLIGPSSIETSEHWDPFVDISGDGGQTWTRHDIPLVHLPPTPPPSDTSVLWEGLTAGALWENRLDKAFAWDGAIQPTLWESAPGCIHAMMRSTRGVIMRADSEDGGISWCPAYPTNLPNNNSGIDVARMDDGTLVLCFNPIAQNWGKRTPISLAYSTDNGDTWSDPEAVDTRDGECSYPAILAHGDHVYVAYTVFRTNVMFARYRVDLSGA